MLGISFFGPGSALIIDGFNFLTFNQLKIIRPNILFFGPNKKPPEFIGLGVPCILSFAISID